MKNVLLIILCLLPLTLAAQHYTFYGSGAGNSYHNGHDGAYIGFHPTGMAHGRNVIFGEWNPRRTGCSIPRLNADPQNQTYSSPNIIETYNHTNIKQITHRATTRTTTTTPAHSDLGLTTELNSYRATSSNSGYSSGSASSPVVYGRTGNKMSFGDGYINSFPSSIPQLATTTVSQNSDNTSNIAQGFLEPPDYEAPLADPLLPLLLLSITGTLLRLTIHKLQVRQKRRI